LDKLHDLGPQVVVITSAMLKGEDQLKLFASYYRDDKTKERIKMDIPLLGKPG